MQNQGDSSLIQKMMASQLRKPSGWLIGWIMLGQLNRWNRSMNRKTLATIEARDDDHVLELGCGGGELLGLIADKISSGMVVGMDWSPLSIRYCKWKFRRLIRADRLDLFCQDVARIPLPNNFIDCVCSVNAVYFWDRPESVFAECARVLKIGGRLVLCNSVSSELGPQDYPPEYFNSHSVEDVAQALQSLGFSIPVIEYDHDKHAKFYTLSTTLQI
jgi:ubiquinone/menaquinone biosynthesis C-methylase UbiE